MKYIPVHLIRGFSAKRLMHFATNTNTKTRTNINADTNKYIDTNTNTNTNIHVLQRKVKKMQI